MKKYLEIMSRPTKLKCVFIVGLAFVGSLLASLWPVKLAELYNNISDGTICTLSKGGLAVLTFGLIYLSAECITILRRVLLDCAIATHEAEIRESSIGKLLKMPAAFYSGSLSGEKTAQLNQGVAGLSQLIKILCNDICATVLTAVCTIAQVLLNAPLVMAGLMMLYLALTVVISVMQIRSQNGIREKIVGQKNALDGQICQSISNLELIRSMSAEEYEKNRLIPSILNISRTEQKHHRYMGVFDSAKQFCKILFQLLLLTASIVLTVSGKMSGASVITVCLLFQQLVKPIDEVYRFMDETASSVVKAKALLEVTETPVDEVFEIESSGEACYGCEIVIEDVIVTNPEKTKQIAWYGDMVIPADSVVAIQGPNGCGKSTLVKLLNRYYPHTQGYVSLFHRSQSSFSQKELTDMLYYTPQSSFFIAGTVRENLLYGIDREVSDEELASALYRVHLTGSDHGDTVINAEAKVALDTYISEKSEELSGGMKQRLSLARAFLRRPRLFIFDEITANLDGGQRDFVLDSIEKYAKSIGAGILYISHDPCVVKRCEHVIELRNKLRENSVEETKSVWFLPPVRR